MTKTNGQIALTVSLHTIIANIALSAIKMAAGIFGRSAAMISDAVHSLSDVLVTFVVIIGVKLASKESDKEHPYGHERLECVAALVLSAVLFATGAAIGWSGTSKILSGEYINLAVPGRLALIAAALSVVIKEGMFWYSRSAAQKINSGVLMADAWHNRSDALSSVGSFAGILGARLGFPILDCFACVVICLFIVKVAVGIFMDATNKMTDKACDDEFVGKVRKAILEQEFVLGVDLLKTRIFGDKIYIDVEIRADKDFPLRVSHEIAERVHDTIEEDFNNVKHCMVRVIPND